MHVAARHQRRRRLRPAEKPRATDPAKSPATPQDARALCKLALAKLAIGDAEGASSAAGAALAALPHSGLAARTVGLVALQRKEWFAAEAANRRALEHDGRDREAANNLALALAAQRRNDEARTVMAMAYSLSRGTGDDRAVLRNQALLEGRSWLLRRRLTRVAWGAFPGVVFFGFFALLALLVNQFITAIAGCAVLVLAGVALRRRVVRVVRREKPALRALPLASGVSVVR